MFPRVWPSSENPVTVTYCEIWFLMDQCSQNQLGPALQLSILCRSLFAVDLEAKLELLGGVATYLHKNATWVPQRQLEQRSWKEQD